MIVRLLLLSVYEFLEMDKSKLIRLSLSRMVTST